MQPINPEQLSKPHSSPFSHDLQLVEQSPKLAVSIGILLTGLIYFFLPDELTLGPDWVLLAIEIVLLLPLWIFWMTHHTLSYRTTRIIGLVLLSFITLALALAIFLLIIDLPAFHRGFTLLRTAGLLWVFTIFVFALWYWEIDGGGPRKRHEGGHKAVDFLFPQQADGNSQNWAPRFFDYLFVSFTGATAFSPTDTYPLTRQAKAFMMVEGVLSLIVVTILVSRVANIF